MISTASALYEEDMWVRESFNWRSQTFSEPINFTLSPADFPHGCTINTIVASVTPNAVRASTLNRMVLRLVRKGNSGIFDIVGSVAYDDGIATQHNIFLSAVNHVLDRTAYEYFATVVSGSGVAPYLDKVYSVYATRTL
jgi:hypothetical protein